MAGEGILPCVKACGLSVVKGPSDMVPRQVDSGTARLRRIFPGAGGRRGSSGARYRSTSWWGWMTVVLARASPRRSMGAAERDAHLIHHQMCVAVRSRACAKRRAICAVLALSAANAAPDARARPAGARAGSGRHARDGAPASRFAATSAGAGRQLIGTSCSLPG